MFQITQMSALQLIWRMCRNTVKNIMTWENGTNDSDKVIQLLLFLVYVLVMGILVSAVINEPISGVVILIIGVPLTAIYLALAIGAVIISGLSQQSASTKNGLNELGPTNPPPTQIKLGPVTLQELPPKQKGALKWIIFILITLYLVVPPIVEISINQGWI